MNMLCLVFGRCEGFNLCEQTSPYCVRREREIERERERGRVREREMKNVQVRTCLSKALMVIPEAYY